MARDIILGVDLEPGEAENTAEDLRKEIENIFNKSYGNETSRSFQQLQARMANLHDRSLETAKALADTAQYIPTERFAELSKQIESTVTSRNTLRKDLTDAKERLDTLGKTVIPTEEYTKLDKALGELKNKYGDIERNNARFVEQMDEANQSIVWTTEHLEELSASLGKLSGDELTAAREAIAKDEMWIKTRQTQIKDLTTDYNNNTAALSKLYPEIVKTEQAIKDLEASGRAYKDAKLDSSYTEQQQRVNELTKEYDEERNKLAELRTEEAGLLSQDKAYKLNPEYERKEKTLGRINNQMSNAIRQSDEMNKDVPEIGGWQMLLDVINQGPKAITKVADTAVATLPPVVQAIYAVVKSTFGALLSWIVNEFKSSFNLVKNAIQKGAVKAVQLLGTAAKSALSGVKKLVSLVGQLASSYVGSKIKGIADSISNIGKSAKSSTPNLKQIGRMFLQYGIGARSLYRLINKLRTALFEGFADLALAYQPFNEAMSSIVTALDYLKNSFAAAFAPIIEFVAPAVSLFVNKMADAVQMVGQFIAALTGKEFVMALPVYKDYAESTKEGAAATREQAKAEKQAKKMAEDEAKAEKKREKALKDVKRTIAGFDDVEILKEPTATTQENLTASIDPDNYNFDTPTLERAMKIFKVGGPLQDGIKQFADLIKKAWLTADAYDLGQKVSKQLGDLLRAFNKSIPQIQEFTTKVARVIASFLAGFLSIGDTFKVLGQAIANVINTIFKTVEAFLTTFMNYDGFKNLGKAIYYTIVNALANINWETIYNVFRMLGQGIAQVLNETIAKPDFWILIFRTLTNALRTILIRIIAFSRELHWGEIGSAIAAGINEGIRNFPVQEAINAITSFFGGLWHLFVRLVIETQWGELGITIANTIVGVFSKIDPYDFAIGLLAFLDGLLTAFKTLIDGIPWADVGTGIATFIITTVEHFPVQDMVNAISAFLSALWTAFINFVNRMKGHWDEIGRTVALLIIGLFEKFDPVEFANGVIAFLDGLWDAFMGFVETPGWDKVVDKIASTIVTFAKNFKWKEKLPGLLKFLNNAIDGLTEILDQLDIPKFLDELYEELRNSKEFQELCEKVVDLVIYFTKLKIKAKVLGFKLIGDSIMSFITGGQIDSVSDFARQAADSQYDATNGAIGKHDSDYESIGAGTGDAINRGLNSATGDINTTADNINTDIQSALNNQDQMTLIGTNNMTAHNKGLMGVRSDIQGSVRTISQDELDAFDGNDFESIGRSQMSDLKSGIDGAGSDISSSASTIKSSIESPFANFDGVTLGKNMLSGIWQGIQDNWNWLYNTVWDLAEDLLNAAERALNIGSPSKVFRDKIGEMIPAGIGVGIEANADSAISSVNSLSNKLVDTAKNMKLPPIAMGEVIPYNSNVQNDGAVTLKSVLDVLQSLETNAVRRDELEEILIRVFREYMNIDFYMGDEKLARHVKRGNSILDRRYNAVST